MVPGTGSLANEKQAIYESASYFGYSAGLDDHNPTSWPPTTSSGEAMVVIERDPPQGGKSIKVMNVLISQKLKETFLSYRRFYYSERSN